MTLKIQTQSSCPPVLLNLLLYAPVPLGDGHISSFSLPQTRWLSPSHLDPGNLPNPPQGLTLGLPVYEESHTFWSLSISFLSHLSHPEHELYEIIWSRVEAQCLNKWREELEVGGREREWSLKQLHDEGSVRASVVRELPSPQLRTVWPHIKFTIQLQVRCQDY